MTFTQFSRTRSFTSFRSQPYCLLVLVPLVLFFVHSVPIPDPFLFSSSAVANAESLALWDAISCLRLPDDPERFVHPVEEREAHFRWLHSEIRKFIPSSFPPHCLVPPCDPWAEDIWETKKSLPFSEFGPFIPLFVPWLLVWRERKTFDYWKAIEQIFGLLLPKYIYVTLSQSDDGLEGRDESNPFVPRNVLVLSQGGKGHIPLLYWMNEWNPWNYSVRKWYRYDLVFVGSDRTHWVRKVAREIVTRPGVRGFWKVGTWWERVYQDSKFVLTPRGVGRSCVQAGEVLMRGMLPVYLYNDLIWLPYYNAIDWSNIGMAVRWDQLNETFKRIRDMPVSRVNAMRARVASLHETHFSSKGTFDHIMKFLRGGFHHSDLRCEDYVGRRNYLDVEEPPEELFVQ
jgi:hypothetical protein